MRKIFFFIILSLQLSSHLYAKQCDTVRVAYNESWFPVAFLSPSDSSRMEGIAHEIFVTLANANNIHVDIVNPIPWKRALMWMDEGKIDVISGHYWSNARNQKWLISDPIFSDDVRVFYHHSLEGKINQMSDLVDHIGVFPSGAAYGDKLDKIIQNKLTTAQFKDNFSILGAIIKNRFDYAILAKLDGQVHVARMGIDNIVKMSQFSLAQNSVHFSFSRNSPCQHLFEIFNQTLKTLAINDSHIKKMLDKARDVYFKEVK